MTFNPMYVKINTRIDEILDRSKLRGQWCQELIPTSRG